MKKVTSSDVAKRAGVSQSTVSFVLNGRADIAISESTRRRVLEAAKQLNYIPGGFSAPVCGGSKTVGVLVPNLSNPYYPMLVQTLETCAAANGYTLLICNTSRREPDERYYLRRFAENGADAVILGFTPADCGYVNTYARTLPVLILGETDEHCRVPTIGLNSEKAGILAAEHLLSLGHKDIAFLTTPPASISLSRKKRLVGVQTALKKRTDCRLTVKAAAYERESADSAFEAEIGYRMMRELLKETRVSAVIGVNDMVAFGALQALTDGGISVPEQVSLCGFDNLYLSQIVSPGITTVDHALPECCRAALSAVIDCSMYRQQNIFRMEYEPRLIVRRSTAPAAR